MGLSFTDNNCLDTPFVIGYERVPLTPDKIIPLLSILYLD